MVKESILTQILLSLVTLSCQAQTYESDFVKLIQKELGGEREVSITSGYIDLLTREYAIEVEFANKWKQAIGQALWYGLQSNKKPGIVLIKKSAREHKYVVQLTTALQYGGLEHKVKIWVWPDDFENSQKSTRYQSPPSPVQGSQTYWLNTSSNKRHNSKCRYFEGSNGRFCSSREGIACKICGG